jgi:hypothetical protein
MDEAVLHGEHGGLPLWHLDGYSALREQRVIEAADERTCTPLHP